MTTTTSPVPTPQNSANAAVLADLADRADAAERRLALLELLLGVMDDQLERLESESRDLSPRTGA